MPMYLYTNTCLHDYYYLMIFFSSLSLLIGTLAFLLLESSFACVCLLPMLASIRFATLCLLLSLRKMSDQFISVPSLMFSHSVALQMIKTFIESRYVLCRCVYILSLPLSVYMGNKRWLKLIYADRKFESMRCICRYVCLWMYVSKSK